MVAHHTRNNLGFAFGRQATAGEGVDRCKLPVKMRS